MPSDVISYECSLSLKEMGRTTHTLYNNQLAFGGTVKNSMVQQLLGNSWDKVGRLI